MKAFRLIYKSVMSLIVTIFILSMVSCDNEDDPADEPVVAEQTVFMYMPWSGKDIYSSFLDNISAFEKAIQNRKGLNGKRLIVFISANKSDACLIDISYKGYKCRRDTLKRYAFNTPRYTTASGISSILADVMAVAQAKGYAMIIGCHGMGWLPVGTSVSNSRKRSVVAYKTRFFGHSSDRDCQTDITTLAEAIKSSGAKMRYILFDDCYMSNIETAYDLKDATDYIIASTCEIMMLGMPYDVIGNSLLKEDFKGVCEGFHSFYSKYNPPCGTIGVTDCREIEQMALIMKEINTAYPDGADDISGIQTLDGLSHTVFFDLGDYVNHICKSPVLLSEFNAQLEKLVPYKGHTETFYSVFNNKEKKITAFSGITISDPSENVGIKEVKKQTAWYGATH